MAGRGKLIGLGCAALLLAGAANAEDAAAPGFLRLTASRTMAGDSEAVDIHVGLFAPKDDKTRSEKVWFYGQFTKRGWPAPVRFRWTDSARCPAALTALRRVRAIEMPRAALPIADPEGYEPKDMTIVLDGRIYSLWVASSTLEGQATSEIFMSSNVETQLASWADALMAALEPCWSTQVPDGVDAYAGTADEAEAASQAH